MKKIAKPDATQIPGAEVLSPLEMNKIHFETGLHSERADTHSVEKTQ